MAALSVTVAGGVTVLPGSITVNNHAVSYVFSGNGNIGGAASLLKENDGTLTISMTGNTYSGGSTLVGGILQIAANSTVSGGAVTSGPLGTGVLTLSGGTLQNDSGASRTLANALSILGNITLGSAGANGLNISGPNTVTISNWPVITVAVPTTIGDVITGNALVRSTQRPR